MGWQGAAWRGPGDEPGQGFAVSPPGADDASRDRRLAGFVSGGEWDTCAPSAELAGVLESVSGPG